MASTLIIYDSVIASFTLSPTGMVNRWMRVKMESARRFSAFYAPKRTGDLAASMGVGPIRYSTTRTRWGLGSHLKYAPFVVYGTTGPITRPNGGDMPVGKSNRQGRWTWAQSVRGQAPDDFMMDALRTAFRGI